MARGTLTTPVARYWQIASLTAYQSFNEVVFAPSVSGPAHSISSATTWHGTTPYDASAAFDGNIYTVAGGTAIAFGSLLSVDLGAAKSVKEVRVYSGNNTGSRLILCHN